MWMVQYGLLKTGLISPSITTSKRRTLYFSRFVILFSFILKVTLRVIVDRVQLANDWKYYIVKKYRIKVCKSSGNHSLSVFHSKFYNV